MAPRYDTLFYDGSCPLCSKEIRILQALQKGNLIFADIHQQVPDHGQLPSREMLLRLRMEQARNLLLESNLSIKEISERLGYARQHDFYRAFRQRIGCSPSAWRTRAAGR